ncbi:MAG: hypothetical protein WCJ74_02105 [bacterium]
MEGPINDLEDFSPEERVKLVEINMKESEIEDYVLNKEINKEWVIELDDILNESFDNFLSENNPGILRMHCKNFFHLVKFANQKLAISISELMKEGVTRRYILTSEQIKEWKKYIDRAKNIIIPRLKKLDLIDSVKLLEGAIIQSEIKIAYDSGVEE